MGNIVNNHGVPLPSQRSDDWVLEETPVKVALPQDLPMDAARRQAGNRIRMDLQRDDLDRRIKDAQNTVTELKPRLDKLNNDVEKSNAELEKKRAASANKKESQP